MVEPDMLQADIESYNPEVDFATIQPGEGLVAQSEHIRIHIIQTAYTIYVDLVSGWWS
jgi:hypothetical protein